MEPKAMKINSMGEEERYRRQVERVKRQLAELLKPELDDAPQPVATQIIRIDAPAPRRLRWPGDILVYLGISKMTFYNYRKLVPLPRGLHTEDEIVTWYNAVMAILSERRAQREARREVERSSRTEE